VLGCGKRLFEAGAKPGAMRLGASRTSATGVVMSTYVPAGEVQLGSFAQEEPSEKEVERRVKLAREVGWGFLHEDRPRGFGSGRSLSCQMRLEGDPAWGGELAHDNAGLEHTAAGIDNELHDGLGLACMNQGADGFDVIVLRQDEWKLHAA
jgi:hypothetical protein